MKKNTNFKFAMISLGAAIIGLGSSGIIYRYANSEDSIEVTRMLTQITQVIAEHMLLEAIILFFMAFVLGEYTVISMRHIGSKIKNADETEFDSIHYAFKKEIVFGQCFLAILRMVGIFFISIVFYQQTEPNFIANILVILFFVYLDYFEVRISKLEQKFYPEKKGDPTSLKYAKQYLESCDEAEKESIYQAAYKSYQLVSVGIWILLLVVFVMHMIWDTGIESIIILIVLRIMMDVSFSINSIKKCK